MEIRLAHFSLQRVETRVKCGPTFTHGQKEIKETLLVQNKCSVNPKWVFLFTTIKFSCDRRNHYAPGLLTRIGLHVNDGHVREKERTVGFFSPPSSAPHDSGCTWLIKRRPLFLALSSSPPSSSSSPPAPSLSRKLSWSRDAPSGLRGNSTAT